MESYTVVRPEHLNQYGHLFGGCLLKWVDEIAWIAASRDNPGCQFVTIGMDRVAFHRGVHQGSVLRFDANEQSRGRTSITYVIRVFADDLNTGAEEAIFSTCITFVRLDENGHKMPLPSATNI
ncbi:acyl-CoA thioesterase [Chromatium okenii]|jgi:acyl-CoA hydrolase|uniref:acyl-CoA thioesterase n=1 Tax=Chromatium okenii TaxID=61644 RepID=UPI0026EF5436|nr:acyl-CoA thioesterase [Chromatium okenii]MBV5311505.1 acyl-CoA thioesterase [Chromatium okenii]